MRHLDRPGRRQLLPRPGRRRLGADGTLARRAAHAAPRRPRAATAEFGEFLRDELAPQGREKEAAGRERYALASRYFLGAKVDLDETYAWGFEELARIEGEMRAVADKIVARRRPSTTRWPRSTPTRPGPIQGKEAFRDWMQALADTAISELHGTHFDIPEQVRRIECCLAPTSDGGDLLHRPERGLLPPGPDVVGGAAGRRPTSPPGAR